MTRKYPFNLRSFLFILETWGISQKKGSRHVGAAYRAILLAALIVTGGLLGVRQWGWLQPLELLLFDQLVRMQSDGGQDNRLLIVTITETDIQIQKKWPISDHLIAQALQKLQQYQPAVIGVDLYRDLPQPPGGDLLLKELQAENVIVIAKVGDAGTGNMEVPPPPLIPLDRIGFNDVVLDPDGVVRRNLMSMRVADRTWFSFSLRVVLSYLQNWNIRLEGSPKNVKDMKLGDSIIPRLKANDGGYSTIDARGYQALLHYRSPQNIARMISLQQLLVGDIDPSWVKDKIILIGSTAASTKDLFFTPYSAVEDQQLKMPGVIIHAQMVSQLLGAAVGSRGLHQGDLETQDADDPSILYWFWPEWLEVIWIAAWAISGGALAWKIGHPAKLGIMFAQALLVLFGLGWGLFSVGGWVPVIPPALTLIMTGAGVMAYKQLYQILHDTLTGLPNRVLFVRRVERAMQQMETRKWLPLKLPPRYFAVLFLDLDRFKIINDSLGHDAGDQLLVAIGERLKTCVRVTDMLARVGGDDFAILLDRLQSVDNATHVAERIHNALALPFSIVEHPVFMSVSIGIALYQETEEHPEHLLRNAHTAMYRAKAKGKARYQIFEPKMYISAVERLELETDLRQAIQNQEFILHYQPLICLKTGNIMGFEALVRWQHPIRGLIPPGIFIGLAEETGLIIPLGAWVLEAACHQLYQWQEKFVRDTPLVMSINLSGRQFGQANLVEQVESIIQKSGCDSQSVKLEITESVVMEDVGAAIELLQRLKSLNIKLGIDDFGTGYSSLSYLNQFPMDTLKVDKSFVARMETEGVGDNLAIVNTIMMLAHSLRMDVIAEGIETAQQLSQLRTLGCEYGQGFFFAKPLPQEQIEELLSGEPHWLSALKSA